jgi:hypothetical protein
MKKSIAGLSVIATGVLTAVVGGCNEPEAIAKKTHAKVQSVKLALASLKRSGYVVANSVGELKATALGRTTIEGPAAPRHGTKMEAALTVVQKMHGKPRQEILAKLINKVELTKAGAATYLSSLQKRIEHESVAA